MSNNPEETVPSVEELDRCGFSPAQIDNLRVLMRLSSEFFAFASRIQQDERINSKVNVVREISSSGFWFDVEYAIGSIFSGIESFSSVCQAYQVLTDAVPSQIAWNNLSAPVILALFIANYRDLCGELDLFRKLRLTIDLFKLQLVFAGMLYE